MKQTVYDVSYEGKTVYMRVDYNVPHEADGTIKDDRRIRSTVPTIQYLLDHGAAVVLASHMGRPKGEVKPELSLRKAGIRLAELLPSCGWLSAAEPAKEGYVGLEVDILCLEVGVGIRFTARIRSGGAVYKRSQKPGMMAPESEILLMS